MDMNNLKERTNKSFGVDVVEDLYVTTDQGNSCTFFSPCDINQQVSQIETVSTYVETATRLPLIY